MSNEQKQGQNKKADELKLPTRAEDFSEWYVELVHRAKLADNSET